MPVPYLDHGRDLWLRAERNPVACSPFHAPCSCPYKAIDGGEVQDDTRNKPDSRSEHYGSILARQGMNGVTGCGREVGAGTGISEPGDGAGPIGSTGGTNVPGSLFLYSSPPSLSSQGKKGLVEEISFFSQLLCPKGSRLMCDSQFFVVFRKSDARSPTYSTFSTVVGSPG